MNAPHTTIPRVNIQVLSRPPRGDFTLWQVYVPQPSKMNWIKPECWVEIAPLVTPGDLMIAVCRDAPFWTLLGVSDVKTDPETDAAIGLYLWDVICGFRDRDGVAD